MPILPKHDRPSTQEKQGTSSQMHSSCPESRTAEGVLLLTKICFALGWKARGEVGGPYLWWVWPCSSAEPEPADLRLLDGDLAPLLLALDSSLEAAGDSLEATGDTAHTHRHREGW